MPGKIVKMKSGLIGKTDNEHESHTHLVMDNSNPFMAKVKQVEKIRVYTDDSRKFLCDPKDIKVIGFWD